mgnify:CR=1 FL=1
MRLPFTLKLFIPVILFFTCIFENAYCSHQVGGEITWTCQGNGTYKFKYTFYNDCFRIFPANIVDFQTNIPGIQNIILNLTQTSSLSTPGFQSGGVNICFTCDSLTGAQPAPGYFGEFIYESDTVHLPGLPPTSGWWFRVSDCCRAYSLTNMPNSSSLYIACRAVMYPYNGRIPGECNDNSPFFVEKPQARYCTGQKTSYSYAAEDLDRDEVQYSWALPIDDLGNNWQNDLAVIQLPAAVTCAITGNSRRTQAPASNQPCSSSRSQSFAANSSKCNTVRKSRVRSG